MIEALEEERKQLEEKIAFFNVNTNKLEEYIKRKAAIERKIASLRGKMVVSGNKNDSFPM